MPGTQLPAGWVAAGYGIPDVCARHGELPVQQRKLQIISRPPPWSYVLILLGAIIFLIVVLVTRKTVKAPHWPFCARCKQQRGRLLAIGLTVIGLAAVAVVGAIALIGSVGSDSAAPGLVLLGAFVLLLAGIVVAARSAPVAVAGAQVSRDGAWILVERAHPHFAHRAAVLQHQAAQHQAAQHQQPYGYR